MKYMPTFESFLTENVLNETTLNNFRPAVLNRTDLLDPKLFSKLMPRTAKTTDEAMERIWMFEGGTMFAHYQYFVVKPNGNAPDRPTYRIHNSQYWLSSYYDNQIKNMGLDPKVGVNTTMLTFFDVTDPKNEKNLGAVWVDTTVYLDEQKRVFEINKQQS